MNSLTLKTKDKGKLKIIFDPICVIYTLHKFNNKGNIVTSLLEVQSNIVLNYIKEQCDENKEPHAAIVCKAINLGLDPTTISSIPN